jgi:hypothetical protein
MRVSHAARQVSLMPHSAVRPFRDLLLALGLTLYVATQLRLSGLPLGPGEVLLILWLLPSAVVCMLRPRIQSTTALRRIAGFWLVLVMAESVGMVVGLSIEPFHDWAAVRNDMMAYSLMLALAIMIAIEFQCGERRDRLERLVAQFGAALLMLQVLDGWGFAVVPGVDPWYFDRLRGWSGNPNQLGLLAAFITILAVDLMHKAKRPAELLAATIYVAPAVLAGVMTKSDSYTLCLLAGGAVYAALRIAIWLRQARYELTLGSMGAVLLTISLPFLILATLPFASAIRNAIVEKSIEMYSDNSQGDVRLNLWKEAIQKGLDSRLIGMGPGPHLTSKSNKRPPPNKFEAHSTPLDLFTQGGLLASMAFVWLSVSTFLATWRARRPALAALVTSLVAFAMLHFVIRHPVFWFAIVFCLLEAEDVKGPARAAARSVFPARMAR